VPLDPEEEKKDKRAQLYQVLQARYTATLDRRKTLTGQATSLMTFAGIIQTILVGLLTTIATNANARQLLSYNTNFLSILSLIRWGFGFYIFTVIVAIFAFIEPKWNIAPIVVAGPINEQIDTWAKMYRNPEQVDLSDFQIQLINATERNRRTNTVKFYLLLVAYGLLLAGIISTGIVGYLIATGITFP